MRGLGDGRFDSEMFIPARRPLHNLELHDMDHDGALDIVAQFTGEVVGICHGDGARGFLLPKPFLWSTRHLGGPTVGDMDSDGWLDIVAPTRLGGIALMRNVGDVPTGVLLDLADASVMGTTVRLRWYATLGNAVSGSVGRRQGSVEEVVGEATRNGEGHLVFIDEDVLPGKYRYQLHYLDGNGVSRSTRTVDVEVGGLETVISSISPNPMMAGGAVATVRWGGIEPTVLECFDVQGRRRFRKAMTGPSGSAEIRIDPGVEWAPGVYVLRLSQGMRQVRRNLVYLR